MLENTVFTNLTFWGRRPSIKAQTLIGGVPDRAHSYLVYNLLFDPEEMIKLDDKATSKKDDRWLKSGYLKFLMALNQKYY